jgi:hypothetical protein
MSKEFDTTEVNVEIIESNIEQPLIQLSELSLSLIGGGGATVTF